MEFQRPDRATAGAIERYGRSVCVDAFTDHATGDGAKAIGHALGLTTRQADAAINAGRWLASNPTSKGGVRPGAGRPLGPMGARHLVTVRVPETLLEDIDTAALAAGVSRSEEIVGRLRRGKRRAR